MSDSSAASPEAPLSAQTVVPPSVPGAGSGEKKGSAENEASVLKDYIELFVRAGLWALFIYVFIFQISVVDGSSMEPQFHMGDRLVIDKVTYRFADIRRFDVVVFEAVDVDKDPSVRRPQDYVKRVIGLPGETVEITDGALKINGQPLNDPHGPVYSQSMQAAGKTLAFRVPPNHYFVIGDNRAHSKDSRDYQAGGVVGRGTLGFVPRRAIRGVVRMRFMPLKNMQWYSRGS